MRPTAHDLEAFYASPVGVSVAARLNAKLSPFLPVRKTDRLLGLGFCEPFLVPLLGQLERVALLMPATQGALPWPDTAANLACLAQDTLMPFPDAMFDTVVAVHALEFIDPVRKSLREIWRILSPAGRLIAVAPNRRGLWAHVDGNPFGNGRPFSQSQLDKLLRDSMFAPLAWERALGLPPFGKFTTGRLDKTLINWLPDFAGVHIVLAQKTDGAAPLAMGRAGAVQAPAWATS
jgi:SAM-dependent methyltransferase